MKTTLYVGAILIVCALAVFGFVREVQRTPGPVACYTVGLEGLPTAVQIETRASVWFEGGCMHIRDENGYRGLCGVRAWDDKCEERGREVQR